MSAKDVSRFLFQPQKRYSSVRMQQGRVILDSDWNESERIDDEEMRRTLLDVLCGKGTSNRGFRVGGVEPAVRRVPGEADGELDGESALASVETYDFGIAAGSFYLGGLRFEVGPEAESFLGQGDWLQIDADPANLPAPPSADELAGGDGEARERFDLVYLRGWEQVVTAVEDGELREQALGGPDTSARIRRMRRVEVAPGGAASCAEAFAELEARLTAPRDGDASGEPHELDAASCELRSKARLTVGFADGVAEDPCKPAVEAGFLGAENQTIRVELTATDRFIWGIDNAAPYYRVQVVGEAGEPVKVKFLTEPRDRQSQPRQGQAVEIHPWGALLPNREKVAELRGHLATVETSYDPETQTITLADPVPQAWLDWLDHPDHAGFLSDRDPDGRKKYFYLRLWTGGSGEADAPDFAFIPGTPVELAGTGLTVTFGAHGLPGDHWIVAARPHTPDLVVGWELLDEAPPAGTRVFFAPLAIVRWSLATGPDGERVVEASVHDCRARFRPLCEVRGCCTATVGDGAASHGDFGSIQEAVDALPGRGGEVCLLPGVHEAGVTIRGRENVRIHGCGKLTVVVPPGEDRAAPLFSIVDSRGVALERMDMVAPAGAGVVVGGTEDAGSAEVEIAHNRILAFEQAVRVESGSEIEIHHNRIRMLDRDGAGVGILLAAEDARVERNDVGVVPAGRRPPGGDPENEPDPTDPCEDPEILLADVRFLFRYLTFVFAEPLVAVLVALEVPFKALGGIQVGAGSERVAVLDNRVLGGAGNGVTLGGVVAPSQPEDGSDEDDGEGEGPVIASPGRSVEGWVFAAGAPAGVGLAFHGGGTTRLATSGADGFFHVAAEPGEYRVAVTTPGFRVDDARFVDAGEFSHFEIDVSRVETRPDRSLAFLYDVRIEDNAIREMGLSGIGLPVPAARPIEVVGIAATGRRAALRAVVQQTGHPVIGLAIRRNRIQRCLQSPFDDAMRARVRSQGLGGVSLGRCAYVDVRENRIEENGRDHLQPVCGVFFQLAAQIEIHENLISDNGPFDAGRTDPPAEGQRGGVVLAALALDVDVEPPGSGPDSARPAARIYDNVVLQPVGQALRLPAVGPVSVCDNRLATRVPGPVEETPQLTNTLAPTPALVSIPAGAVIVLDLGTGARASSGATLFADNQVRLESIAGAFVSVLVASIDDVGFAANQSEVFGAGSPRPVFVNALVRGRTLRTLGNRFRETVSGPEVVFVASAATGGQVLNDTSHNQGDHCIFVANQDPAHPAIDQANLEIDDAFCRPFVGVVDAALRNDRIFTRL